MDGIIYANIWQRNCIAQIDPTTGHVIGWVDLSGLPAQVRKSNTINGKHPQIDVLNGIAWDSKGAALYVTGKLWPTVYQIELRPLYSDSKSTNVDEITEKIRQKCMV